MAAAINAPRRAGALDAAIAAALYVGATSGADGLLGLLRGLQLWTKEARSTMPTLHKVLPNLYRDSVTLMQLANTRRRWRASTRRSPLWRRRPTWTCYDTGVTIEGCRPSPTTWSLQ